MVIDVIMTGPWLCYYYFSQTSVKRKCPLRGNLFPLASVKAKFLCYIGIYFSKGSIKGKFVCCVVIFFVSLSKRKIRMLRDCGFVLMSSNFYTSNRTNNFIVITALSRAILSAGLSFVISVCISDSGIIVELMLSCSKDFQLNWFRYITIRLVSLCDRQVNLVSIWSLLTSRKLSFFLFYLEVYGKDRE